MQMQRSTSAQKYWLQANHTRVKLLRDSESGTTTTTTTTTETTTTAAASAAAASAAAAARETAAAATAAATATIATSHLPALPGSDMNLSRFPFFCFADTTFISGCLEASSCSSISSNVFFTSANPLDNQPQHMGRSRQHSSPSPSRASSSCVGRGKHAPPIEANLTCNRTPMQCRNC